MAETISVEEAAKRLGISPRAVRFRLEKGQLAGTRALKTWQVLWERAAEVPEALPEGLPETAVKLPEKEIHRKRFPSATSSTSAGASATSAARKESKKNDAKRLEDLSAFRLLRSAYSKLPQGGEGDPHRAQIQSALTCAARGFFQWHKAEKAQFYNACRNHIADALVELSLFPLGNKALSEEIVNILELEAMSSVVGLTPATPRLVHSAFRAPEAALPS